jgi:two-component system sensor histidine kinase PilS (NtrC family)
LSAGSRQGSSRGARRQSAHQAAARKEGRSAPEESWFGALGVGDDTRLDAADADALHDESRYDGDWSNLQGQSPLDSRFISRQARRLVSTTRPSFQRIYRAFLGARAALGMALLGAQVVASFFSGKPPALVLGMCVAYAAVAVSIWLLPGLSMASASGQPVTRLRRGQWLLTIGVDVLAFSALHALASASSLNYVALLVLPVLMAGVLTSRLAALATAALVAIILLGTAWLNVQAGGVPSLLITQAGLAGIGFFVITILAGELAGRLAREELTARGSLELARQQAQLNRLVIEEMQEGVLVVDRRGRVRAANPAARLLLAEDGMTRQAPFQLRGVAAWEPLVKSVEKAFAESIWPEAGRDVLLSFASGGTRQLRLRVRFTRRRDPRAPEEFCVLFLEDVRTAEARVRQEKLAAMGRVSAGIAHEIRNPLAAISQANALLSEDATTPGQRQLTQMVADNVQRLKRIVDDVMEVAPGTAPEAGVIELGTLVASVCSEWARTAQLPLGERSPLKVGLPDESVGARFDEDHLRRVLVNLLDNAHRHGTKATAAVWVRLMMQRETDQLELSVLSDGPPIAPDVERYLFEPFFSTRSRGTGLGLYICRELCERYGASIDYRQRPATERHRNEFFITLKREPLLDLPEARLQI